MKGVEPLIAAIFIILISIAGAVIVLESSQPSVDRLKEISLFEESKKILTQIDNAVRTVSEEGEGSTRVLQLSVSGGNYFIDTNNDAVVFSMDSRSQIVGVGVSKTEGSINMLGEPDQVLLNISFSRINITGGGSFGKGYHSMIIRNNGYDSASGKQIVSISTEVIITPITAFTVQYNQTQTLVLKGASTNSPDNLNDLGINYYGITEAIVDMGSNFIYQRRPNANDATQNDCINKQNAYNYDASLATCNGGGTRDGGYWWNNTIEFGMGTINSVMFGVKLSTSGSRSNDNYFIEYGFASVPESCTSVTSWTRITTNQFPGTTLTWYNVTNTTPVTWQNINNTCFRFRYQRASGDDGYIVYIDAFHIDVSYSIPSTYRMEVEHNATGISFTGNLDNISVSLNMSTSSDDMPTFNFIIYNFNSGNWDLCGTPFNPTANNWYTVWCNKTSNPGNYLGGGIIRVRLNETAHQNLGEVREDYIQYYITYT